ncbi:hypothetical protein ACNS7O_11735 [Haloferacaceae archaeon DSL9]
MGETVKLSRVESTLERLDYPVTRSHAAAEFDETTLLLADGEANLGEIIDDIRIDSFDSPEDLYAELNNAMPIEALGEPRQSEGDA